MKTSSCKAKGRRACAELKTQIINSFPELGVDDIVVTPSGVKGEDLTLSPFARSMVPFSFEVKNQERLSIWDAIKQAKKRGGQYPFAVAFTRNHSDINVVISLNSFLFLLRRLRDRRAT